MKRRLRMGMAGGGVGAFIGEVHRKAARMDGYVDIVAGAFSTDPKKTAQTGRELGLDPARCYATYGEMLAAERRLPKGERIDFVSICTPNESHFAIAKACLEAGFHVMCEKPMTLTVAEAEELERLVKKTHLVFGLMHTYTGYPMVKLARDLIRKGELGKIDKIVLEYQQGSFRKPNRRINNWKMDPKIAGPSCVLADLGVHAFTLIEYVTGLEVETLLADVSTYGNDAGLDDDASVLMRLTEGAKASLVTSKVATGEENGVRLRVYGEKASLYWDQEVPNYVTVRYPSEPDRIYRRKGLYVGDVSPASLAASRFPAGHHEGFVEAFANIYDGFVSAVRSRSSEDFPGAREGIRSMRFVKAALDSAHAGSVWVTL